MNTQNQRRNLKLLLISENPQFAEQWGSKLNGHTICRRDNLEQAEPLLANRMVDACLLDVPVDGVQTQWQVEKLKRLNSDCPIILLAQSVSPDWVAEAYSAGVTAVLNQPVMAQAVHALLSRLHPAKEVQATTTIIQAPKEEPRPVGRELAVLELLKHCHDRKELLQGFTALLQSSLGIHRCAIYLAAGDKLEVAESRGVSSVQLCELSLHDGIGAHVRRTGRVVTSDTCPTFQREFQTFNLSTAFPILHEAELLGIAFVDDKLTGEKLSPTEVLKLFQAFSSLGAALAELQRKELMQRNYQSLVSCFKELSVGCVIFDRDHRIVFANRRARGLFNGKVKPDEATFHHLNPELAMKVYQVQKTQSSLVGISLKTQSNEQVEVTLHPVYPDGAYTGQCSGVMVLCTDKPAATAVSVVPAEVAA